MLIELSKFSDKLRQYRLILEKLTAEQQDYERRRERLSKLSQRRRSSRKPDVAECYMCNANIKLESTDSFATCRGCERLVCRGESCCQWVESIGIWECTGCQSHRVIQQKAGEWLLNQLTVRLQQPGPVELKDGNLLGLGLDTDDAHSTTSTTVAANQRIKVREFIEELLSAMLHGPLDDVSVGQLMKNESYLPLWEGQQQHHSPSDQHFELKRLIQKILEEIGKLPELLNHSGLPLRPEEHLPYFDPKKYEQLVATAVLNKVVDDYRNPKNFTDTGDVAGKSNVAAKPYGGAGAVDINHNQLTEGGGSCCSGSLDEEALRQRSVTADDIHAHETAATSYSAAISRRLSDTDESYLSDYIQRHTVPLPDLSDTTTGSGSGAEDDDLQSLKSNATDGTWEENWLFRKRQLKTTESSIAMLVPSPTEEVKALIGDKNVDEISDLSEAGSDCEGYESDSNVQPLKAATGEVSVGDLPGSSSKETSDELPSESKLAPDSLEENLPLDSLVSISSLPRNENVLSEATNSQLLAEQGKPSNGGRETAVGTLIEDLISIGTVVSERVETANPTLTNPFMDDPFKANNGVITDDVKLLQRTEANDNRSSASEPYANGHGDRKEVPIDRANHQQHTHTNIYPSNPVADSLVEPVATERSEDRPSTSVVVDSEPGSGARETNLTDNTTAGKNINLPERLKPEVPSLLLLDSFSPPGSPLQQVLSPHPIMMTITDVFDRMANSSSLAAISEELPPAMLLDAGDTECHEIVPLIDSCIRSSPPATTIILEELQPAVVLGSSCSPANEDAIACVSRAIHYRDYDEPVEMVRKTSEAILSPMDSFQTNQDESEYRTVSEASNDSPLLGESFDEPSPGGSWDIPCDPHSLQRSDEEFTAIIEQNKADRVDKETTTIVPQSSPELIHILQTPPAAIYVPNHDQAEFAEQLSALETSSIDALPKRNPFEKEEEDADNPSRITLHADLVTFDNNSPSPEQKPGIAAVTEQMRAYCEQLKGILNRPLAEADHGTNPPVDEAEQWEMVESPESLEALAAFRDELQMAAADPAQTAVRACKDHPIRDVPLLELGECFPSALEIGCLKMAEYSVSLKNIEYVEETIPMDEQAPVLPYSSIQMERISEAFFVASPVLLQHTVAINHTASADHSPSLVAHEEVHPNEDELAELHSSMLPTEGEPMLASLESCSESKIDDTSMPFSDTDLPSLSSSFVSTSPTVPATTTINNCMPTNITDQVSTPRIRTSIDIDTNPSNNTRVGSDLPLDSTLAGAQTPIVADCSIIPAQKAVERPATVSNGNQAQPQMVETGDEQTLEFLSEADTLIPGSIAEREHLKWRNAKPIANNPYSPDALQRRLSEKSRPSSMIEIDRLVKKDGAPNGSAGVLMDDEDPPKELVDSGAENDRSLQSVMGGGLSEKKKIGREYYINDPERLRTGGSAVKQTLGVSQHHQQQQQQPQLSHSTDDEKSLLLGRNVEDNPGEENIFAARPIQVTADDPVLQKGTKGNYLSTAAREIFLIPLEPEPLGSLVSTESEQSINSPSSSSGARPELDSLTYSEDSDVTRIYDLTTGEGKVFRPGGPAEGDTILLILPQHPSPVNQAPSPLPVSPPPAFANGNFKPHCPSVGPEDRTFRPPGQFVVQPLSPETIKFFAPKRKRSFTGSSGSLVGDATKDTSGPGRTNAPPSPTSMHIEFPASRSTNGCEFSIIEKDVIDLLPSVKELAKCYSGSNSDICTMPPKPLYKPRDFLRQSSDVLNEEGSGAVDERTGMPGTGTKGQRQYSSTSSIAVRDEIREIRKINLDAYKQQSTFYPMAPGHSITARSLSKQIREHKTNVTDDHKVGQHGELPGNDGDGNGGHASPERPSSPVFLPGHLRSSIEFFENLRNKP